MKIYKEQQSFEIVRDMVDVTSASRPDPSWIFIDAAGHEHRWYVNGQPATEYNPSASYELPTLKRVDDEPYITEDGDEVGQSHLECSQCGETIYPRTTADQFTQYIPGLRRFYINDRQVTKEEFERAAREAGIMS